MIPTLPPSNMKHTHKIHRKKCLLIIEKKSNKHIHRAALTTHCDSQTQVARALGQTRRAQAEMVNS